MNYRYGYRYDDLKKRKSSFVGALDNLPLPELCYSLRRLVSSYTGPLIRVQRESDSTEMDISALPNGDLDVASLESFCTGTNGACRILYSQGNSSENAIQDTYANMARIVTSGSVLTTNGKPKLLFDGSDDIIVVTLRMIMDRITMDWLKS